MHTWKSYATLTLITLLTTGCHMMAEQSADAAQGLGSSFESTTSTNFLNTLTNTASSWGSSFGGQ